MPQPIDTSALVYFSSCLYGIEYECEKKKGIHINRSGQTTTIIITPTKIDSMKTN